jgi:aryl-alcohol dehydrogenase-like predicted oxidoreductase
LAAAFIGAAALEGSRMQYRNLGRSGLLVSSVGLGCNNFGGRIDLEQTRAVVDKAIEAGITLFDTADAYGNRGGSETALGEVIGERRKDIVLATKFGMQMDAAGRLVGASRGYVISAVEASLRRLKTDWIDLYQLHRPDPSTPMEETLRALDDLVCQGKVRYVGCSNLGAWQFADAQWISRTNGFSAFVSIQDEYNLLQRDIAPDLIPAALHFGAGLLPYYPLAGGLLTGKYRRGAEAPAGTRYATTQALADRYMTDHNWAVLEKLQAFCTSRGRSLLDVAFAWLLSQSATASVIAGATRPEQVEANVRAAEWTLDADELAELEVILSGRPAN